MTAKKSTHAIDETVTGDDSKLKKCFIIMPIADHPDYEHGHFKRVYEHLIQPACEMAGYKAIRADDSKASHMIMFDILKKITECDMAICDLSSKNANVFYELGLRQAFNKKTILITDGKEKAPFDLAGFRYVEYSPSLRTDSVKTEIIDIYQMLIETESLSEEDVNSIVKLLQIKPAKVEPVELNDRDSVIFNMFAKLQDQIESLKPKSTTWLNDYSTLKSEENFLAREEDDNNDSRLYSLYDMLKTEPDKVHSSTFRLNNNYLGKLVSIMDGKLIFEQENPVKRTIITNTDSVLKKIIPMRKRTRRPEI